MGFRRALLVGAMRRFEKPRLARASDPRRIRPAFERAARLLFRDPPHARYLPGEIAPGLAALWAAAGSVAPRAAILHFHGGGYVMGSPCTHRAMLAALSARCGIEACLPAYRLAPEHVFPAALEDALAAYEGLLLRGYAPARVALGGDSAGGGLMFALLATLEDAGLPRPGAVYAFSPWVDMTGRARSLHANAAHDALLPAGRLAALRAMVLAGADPADPRASPVFASFTDPPPALVLVGAEEILLDDARTIVARLRACGGEARCEVLAGLPHVWPIFQGLLPEADRSLDMVAGFLRARLLSSGP